MNLVFGISEDGPETEVMLRICLRGVDFFKVLDSFLEFLL